MIVEIDLPEGYEENSGYSYSSEIESMGGCEFLNVCIPLRKKRWRAEDNVTYWEVTSRITTLEQYDHGDRHDNRLYEIGNYFKTEAEAQAMADKIKKLLKEG